MLKRQQATYETLHFDLEALKKPALRDAFRDKVHYCCEAIVACRIDSAQPGRVELDIRAGSRAEVEEKVARFCKQLVKGFFPVSTEVLLDHRDRRRAGAGIVAELLDKRWLVPYARGCLGMQGPALALYNYLDGVILAIARGVSAAEASFPSLMSIDALHEADYLASFPQHLTTASPVAADMDKVGEFVAATEKNTGDALSYCSEPTHVLAPTVCIHAYRAMRYRTLEDDELVTLTARGHCFRHERNRLDYAGRLWNFTMREIVFVGDAEKVEHGRRDVLVATHTWLDSLGMAYAIESATDPFFVSGHAAQSFFQLTNRTKLELRMEVEGTELAVGSFNHHRAHFGKNFGIRHQGDNRAAHSACVGFGLERLVLAFFAQLGTKIEDWPEPLQEALCKQNLSCF
jgi:hypothetical protein